MRSRTLTLRNALLLVTLVLSGFVHAQTESTLYTFKETTSFWPQGGLLEALIENSKISLPVESDT